jgi:trans-aconitate 2-methyltransferase
MSEVAEFYDEFTERQLLMGINARNVSIQRWLEEFGLQKNNAVLEIGCGIGTQTQLLAEYLLPTAKITANDISTKSVDIARKRLAKHTNIEWIAEDFLACNSIKEKYDVVLLPDVIEHIPIELHSDLFKKIHTCLKPSGFVLIHIPDPMFLDWCTVHMQDKLQIIDQPIFTDILIQNTYPHGYYIHYLKTYSIWIDNGDYQVIVLKPKISLEKRVYNIIPTQVSLYSKSKAKVKQVYNKFTKG